jgi:hypothetical protein
LQTVKRWISEEGKFNVKEAQESTTYFTLILFHKKEGSGLLPVRVTYSKDSPCKRYCGRMGMETT